jgi:predicted RNase H-like HicB family nuclease
MVHLTEVEGSAMENLAEVNYCPECGRPLIAVPVLRCAHCGEEVALRSFTFGPVRGKYFAECIDLDLATQGDTIEEAIGKLQEAMFGYIETVFSENKSTKGLVLRPSPLSHRLRYRLRALSHRLDGIFRGRQSRHLLPQSDRSSNVRLSHC